MCTLSTRDPVKQVVQNKDLETANIKKKTILHQANQIKNLSRTDTSHMPNGVKQQFPPHLTSQNTNKHTHK